jgi:hypothetical protein
MDWTVFLHQDLTPRQRQKRKLLVQEMKKRQGDGEQNLMTVTKRERKLSPQVLKGGQVSQQAALGNVDL